MLERIYKDRLICDLRIIRKQNQATEKCHHLQIVLRSCQMRNLFTGNKDSLVRKCYSLQNLIIWNWNCLWKRG